MKVISKDAVLRLLDENGVVFRKTIEDMPALELVTCEKCEFGAAGQCMLTAGAWLGACTYGKERECRR